MKTTWMKMLVGVVAIGINVLVGTGFAGTYVQPPIDDALVNSTKPTTNYGAATYLAVYFDGSVYNQSYLKFDLSSIPDASMITSARLWLYSYPNTGTTPYPKPLVALNYVSSDAWYESTVTWNTKPAYGALLDSSTPDVEGWQSFDLLEAGAWNYAADLADNALSLIVREGEPLTSTIKRTPYYSDEYATTTLRPYVSITYAPVPEPATMMLIGSGLVGLMGLRRKK